MTNNEIKRNIIMAILGLIVILALLVFEVFSSGIHVDYYNLIIIGFGTLILISILKISLKERKKASSRP